MRVAVILALVGDVDGAVLGGLARGDAGEVARDGVARAAAVHEVQGHGRELGRGAALEESTSWVSGTLSSLLKRSLASACISAN